VSIERAFNRTLNRVWGFIEDRSGIPKWALRPQPAFTFKPSYWTGAFVANAFFIQILTGLLLLLYYQPTTSPSLLNCGQAPGTLSSSPGAWCSTYYIVHSVPMGNLLLSSHLYGSYAMIFLAFVHFFRGFYLGVYKAPREFSWMVGTLLLLATLGMGFTGYLLPYTQLSLNATNVGIVLTSQLPTLGPLTVPFITGDGTPQGLLSRMFALHVLIIPLGLGALLYAHIALFESHGIAPPATSDPTQRQRYTHREDEKHVPFWPHIFFYITKWALLYLGLLFGIAALWPWSLPTYAGNLAAAGVVTEPDWYFLWLFKIIDFSGVSPVIAIGSVTALILFVLVLPFLDRSKRRHPRDRPVFVIIANSLLGIFLVTTVWGGLTPGVQIPAMQVAARLVPIVLLNIVLVPLFYWRYQRTYRRRLIDRGTRFRLPGVYPTPPARPRPGPAPGGTSAPASAAQAPAHRTEVGAAD
jgi:quinol-cytochrome oxidoreductase complex cytochrome b subunit